MSRRIVRIVSIVLVLYCCCFFSVHGERLVKYYYGLNGTAFNVYELTQSEFEELTSSVVTIDEGAVTATFTPKIIEENVLLRSRSDVAEALRHSNWVVVRENNPKSVFKAQMRTFIYEKKEDGSITRWAYEVEIMETKEVENYYGK